MGKAIYSKDEAEQVAISYNPKKFPFKVHASAVQFVAIQSETKPGSSQHDFHIDRLVAKQTGVEELERMSIEEKVELEALSRVKALQENAYAQAYQIGIEEGREKAFSEYRNVLVEKFNHFDTLVASVETLKSDLVSFNESHIVSLIFYMAKRLAMSEVTQKPELILEVVRHAIESAQTEEKISIRVSPEDFKFIEGAKEKLGKEFEKVKRAKFEASDSVKSGGCIVQTNYGDVDATVEQRLEKLWNAVMEKLPKVKDEIGE